MTTQIANETKPLQSMQKPVYFNAVLHPHRSLSPQGFLIIMCLIAGISFTAGTLFFLQGAWPVLGFFGLDVALVWYAFKHNYQTGRVYETIRLTEDKLEVRHVSAIGEARTFTLEPYWVRIVLEEQGRNRQLL